MSRMIKNVENVLKRYIKPVVLLVILLIFGFPDASLSQGFEQDLSAAPRPKESIKAYYSGPTLPNIPARSARRTVVIVVTSYNSEPGQTDGSPFITASGTRARDGVVAANFLPIGTIVRFPEVFGQKEFVVEDRMNARYYYRADIWMADKQESLNFGAKVLKMEIL